MMPWHHHPLLLRSGLSSHFPRIAPSFIAHSILRRSSQHPLSLKRIFIFLPDCNIVHHYTNTKSSHPLSQRHPRHTLSHDRSYSGTASNFQNLLKALRIAWKGGTSEMPSVSRMCFRKSSLCQDNGLGQRCPSPMIAYRCYAVSISRPEHVVQPP